MTAAVRHGDVTLADGIRLHYAESGDPGGDPVLFLHGVTDSSRSFDGVLGRLPATSRR